jgi:hypothetical protein
MDVVSFIRLPFYPGERVPIPTGYKAGRAPKLVWTLWKRIVPLPRIDPRPSMNTVGKFVRIFFTRLKRKFVSKVAPSWRRQWELASVFVLNFTTYKKLYEGPNKRNIKDSVI